MAMSKAALHIIIAGIKVKVNRGEVLEEILTEYTKLTEEEKEYIRKTLA